MLLCRQGRVSPSLPLGHPRFVWSHMSEADRVFSRMTTPGSLPSPEDKQFLHIASRRRGAVASQSRVVEVVHRRSGRIAPAAEPVQAPTWSERLQGCSTPALPAAQKPAAPPAPSPPVGHLMPGWEPLLPPLEPVEPAAKIRTGDRLRPRVAKPERANIQSTSTQRAF